MKKTKLGSALNESMKEALNWHDGKMKLNTSKIDMPEAKRKKSNSVKFLEKISGVPLTLGQLLESIRLGDEISQVKFAEKLHISKSHLCDIEKGRKPVSASRAANFAKTLGYSPEQFVRLALEDRLIKLETAVFKKKE